MCIRWYFIYCHHVVSSQQQHPKGNCLGFCLRTQWDHSSVHPTRSAWVHHCFSPHQSINFHQTHQKLNSKVNFKRLTNKSILLLLFFFPPRAVTSWKVYIHRARHISKSSVLASGSALRFLSTWVDFIWECQQWREPASVRRDSMWI